MATSATTYQTVPGSIGWLGLGDKTIEFAYSPLEFIKKRMREHRSPIFKVRVLNKPTIFLTSNNAVKELLQGKYLSNNNKLQPLSCNLPSGLMSC